MTTHHQDQPGYTTIEADGKRHRVWLEPGTWQYTTTANGHLLLTRDPDRPAPEVNP